MPLDLTVVILTKNEALHIARALDNIKPIAQRIVVVDSYSSDKTVDIARSKGAEVFQHQFVNYAKQFQWALENTNITTAWIMRLDADELIERDLAEKLQDTLPTLSKEVVGINLKRKHIFMDKWVRHGGRYPLVLLRIWRLGHGRIEDRWMDEHMIVWGGGTITLDGGFADHNLNDLTFFTTKHNGYATREAIDVLIQKHSLTPLDEGLTQKSASVQAAYKRFFKETVYNKLPFTWSALLYFLWRYLIQLGFLDGRSGLIYHFLQGYWYRFLVGAKILEIERTFGPEDNALDKCTKIFNITGHSISTNPRK